MSPDPIGAFRSRRLWLSLVGVPVGFSDQAMELTAGDPELDEPKETWPWLQSRGPRAFIAPGTFCPSERSKLTTGLAVWESYNVRSITIDAPPLAVLLKEVRLTDAPTGPGEHCRGLHLPEGGLHVTAEAPAQGGATPQLLFPVGSLLLRDFVEPQHFGVLPLVPNDRSLVATAKPRMTANGWSRRAFLYEDPARLFSPSAILYRDRDDQVAFVEEFTVVGEAVVVERYALEA